MSKCKEYIVTWSCDVSATSTHEAARKALQMIVDKNSIAHYFNVYEVHGTEPIPLFQTSLDSVVDLDNLSQG